MTQAVAFGVRQCALDLLEREAERLRLQDHGERLGRTLVIFAVAGPGPAHGTHQAFILKKADFRRRDAKSPRQFTDLHRQLPSIRP